MDPSNDCNNNDDSEQLQTVKETRLKWMLNADKALAEQLQSKEFKEHYQQNKEKNIQLREDLSRAKTLAQEIDKGRNLQIEVDRMLANHLSEELEQKAEMETIMQQLRDEELARGLQQLELDGRK